VNQSEGGTQGEITRLLVRWRSGEAEALNRLFPLVYDGLRDLARRQLRRGGRGQTLGTTALVHEAYLKLVDHTHVELRDRGHFFSLAARAMRQIIIDDARRRMAGKRGGGERRLSLDEAALSVGDAAAEMLAVDEALKRLEALDERMGRLVELRFFGGLSVEETAESLDVSPRTVKRDWQKARAFLYRELAGAADAR